MKVVDEFSILSRSQLPVVVSTPEDQTKSPFIFSVMHLSHHDISGVSIPNLPVISHSFPTSNMSICHQYTAHDYITMISPPYHRCGHLKVPVWLMTRAVAPESLASRILVYCLCLGRKRNPERLLRTQYGMDRGHQSSYTDELRFLTSTSLATRLDATPPEQHTGILSFGVDYGRSYEVVQPSSSEGVK